MTFEILTSFRFVPKENSFWNSVPCKRKSKKCKKLKQSKKVPKSGLTEPPFGEYMFYLISSTSMQKENPVANSVCQIKIRYAKYKVAERSHNFLMQLPMQLIFGDRWDLDKLQTCTKGKSILEFPSVWKEAKKSKKLKQSKKRTKKMVWPSRPLESLCSFD